MSRASRVEFKKSSVCFGLNKIYSFLTFRFRFYVGDSDYIDSNSTNFLITTTSSNTIIRPSQRWAGKACVIISPHRSSPVFVLPLISMIYRRFYFFFLPWDSRYVLFHAFRCTCTERSRWWWWFSYFMHIFSWYFVSFAIYYFGWIRNGSGLVAKIMERSDGL